MRKVLASRPTTPLFASLFALLLAGPASAASLTIVSGVLMGATDVSVTGTRYNVEFLEETSTVTAGF